MNHRHSTRQVAWQWLPLSFASAVLLWPRSSPADVVTIRVDSYVTPGACGLCEGDATYGCTSGYPEWHESSTFADPTPAGSTVTQVTVSLFGVDCDNATRFRVELDGTLVQDQIDPAPTNCTCGGCTVAPTT